MQELRKEMTWEEYKTFPRKLGWKYEYFDGALHLSPASTASITLWLSLEDSIHQNQSTQGNRNSDLVIRTPQREDLQPLLTLFCECFEDFIEYAGCSSQEIMRCAHASLDAFFHQKPMPYGSCCRVAEEQGKLIGCAMIAAFTQGAILQPIFVSTNRHRQGIATSILKAVSESLLQRGAKKLYSRCNLGNEASIAWHASNGFVELPSYYAASHRANIYQQESERQEILQLPTADEMRKLAKYWSDERRRLTPTHPPNL